MASRVALVREQAHCLRMTRRATSGFIWYDSITSLSGSKVKDHITSMLENRDRNALPKRSGIFPLSLNIRCDPIESCNILMTFHCVDLVANKGSLRRYQQRRHSFRECFAIITCHGYISTSDSASAQSKRQKRETISRQGL